MQRLRRNLLKAIGAAVPLVLAAGAGLLRTGNALAAVWNKTGFEAKATADALKPLGVAGAQASKDITLTAPDIAENGAQVPVTVTSRIPNTRPALVESRQPRSHREPRHVRPRPRQGRLQTRWRHRQGVRIVPCRAGDCVQDMGGTHAAL